MHFLLAGWLILAQGVTSSVPVTKPADARIEGSVIRSGTGEAVYNATITLRQIGNQQVSDKTANTDRQGHFAFPDLDPGNYVVTAFAGGYVIQQTGFNQRVTLAAGQAKTDLVFTMVPTATVTGRVFDDENQPLTGADVELLRVAYDVDGVRTYQVFEQVRTDDLGQYRLFWITPGQYFLRADYAGTVPMRSVVSPNEYRGARPNYVSTYYPNTAAITSAGPLDLQPGGEEDAIDIRMVSTRTYSVRGRAISIIPGTNLMNASVVLSPKRLPGPVFGSPPGMTGNSRIAADGSFEIKNVPPGPYELSLGAVIGQAGPSGTNRVNLSRSIEVGEGDVDGIQLALTPPFEVQGQVLWEGVPTAADPTKSLRLSLRSIGDTGAVSLSGILANTQVSTSGVFVLPQVASGKYRAEINGLPLDSYVKSVTVDGTDVLQNGVTLTQAPENPLEIVISFNGGHLEGHVLDKDNNPAAGRHVVLIPADRSRSDLYKDVVCDPNGKFIMRGLTPGSYKLFSWDSIENNAYRNPDFLNPYEDRGLSVTVTEGQNSPVEVHLIL